MPETAEEVASVDGITREDADAFACESSGGPPQRSTPGTSRPRSSACRPDAASAVDEGPRRDTTLEVLAGLRPGRRRRLGRNGRQLVALNDGASAILVASAAAVERTG